MIVTKIIGGIGNQFFQYAIAKQLSTIHNTELLLDISGFKNYNLHKYSLSKFKIKEKFYNPKEHKLLHDKYKYFLKYFLLKKSNYLRYIKEKNLNFDSNVLNLPNNIYLDGYWQSQKYFKSISEVISREFNLKIKLSQKSSSILKKIRNTESISMHFRRKDFLKYKIHGTCDISYYLKCVKYINNKIINPHFFLFSDDPNWVTHNIKLKEAFTVIKHNGPNSSFEDLKLMSSCQHNIIANSTFSWWGAWLNKNPKKIILAPKIWYADKNYNNQTEDLIPKYWIRIK